MNDLRTGFLERHRKRLHEAIDIVLPPAKKVCPERAEEDLVTEAPPSTMPQPDEVGPSVATATQPDVVGPSAAAMVQPDVAAPSNALIVEEVLGTEGGLDALVIEKAQDEKSSPAPYGFSKLGGNDGDAEGSVVLHGCGGSLHEDV